MRKLRRSISTILWAGMLVGSASAAPEKNGFYLTTALVAADEVLPGGPPRDGISAIDRPQFISAASDAFLAEDDRVLGNAAAISVLLTILVIDLRRVIPLY